MITTPTTIQDFLATTSPFAQLSPATLERVAAGLRPLRYRMGQAILVPDTLPTQLHLIYQGQVRLLGYDPRTGAPVTLKRLQAGETVGEAGLVRGIPCETAIASTETYCLTLPARIFFSLLDQESAFAAAFQEEAALCEIFDLLGKDLAHRADGCTDLKALTFRAWPEAVVYSLPSAQSEDMHLDPERVWFLSSGSLANREIGERLLLEELDQNLRIKEPERVRLIGLRTNDLHDPDRTPTSATLLGALPWEDVPTAPDHPPVPEAPETGKPLPYPFKKGRGPVEAPLACFGMLAQHLDLPFRRDVIRRILAAQVERGGSVSLPLCGAIAEVMGLKAQLVETPADVFPRLQAPALILYQGSLALVYKISTGEIVLAMPEQGLRRLKPEAFLEQWALETEGPESAPENHPVLLLESTRHTPQQRFSLRWFWPSVQRHRKVLVEVLIASFFVQLFALANPLVTQVIIDKVLVQNSLSTLHVLGIFLVVVALFEALLSSFRTYLFVDTTNRIDLTLGSEVIDHLLRLPLRYFERRPVGELASRVNELENIRQFLTGTALTVVLDAVFSVIYIVVMVIYSWLLTLVALATVPLFALLTFIVAPITRQQARTKAERNAETQSYLVEVVSGIQTVKAQNIELKSRWQWQERYARYVSAGFEAVATSTTAGSVSSFLNKLSSLLLLWVGAVLVLKGQLTLGQLIAFRIIAGYTTSPLLRLIQLWQNFQETALSLERLADILDHPQEVSEPDRNNIPMPVIRGAVRFDDITFAFADKGPLQLKQINLEFAAGTFVGIAGQSGSGKSTLVKLLMRLYDPQGGRILVDGYDIHKVELYSLRRQIGMVLQDSLLFDGTVQENIALTRPDATAEEIIEAARIAYAHDFIMELPQGYNTRVGERGSALSGGQRQRIAIARAVLQNPQLLILDEATSALDYNAEHQVCLNLREAFQGRTVFFITHRLSTLKPADVIVMMDQGRVAEQGTHEALMALQGTYYCLYQQQEAQA